MRKFTLISLISLISLVSFDCFASNEPVFDLVPSPKELTTPHTIVIDTRSDSNSDSNLNIYRPAHIYMNIDRVPPSAPIIIVE